MWRGTYGGQRAALVITQEKDSQFEGTITVDTKDGPVRVAVIGDLFADTNEITLRETRVLEEPSKGYWSLGVGLGRMSQGTQMMGEGEDNKNRPYTWAFMR